MSPGTAERAADAGGRNRGRATSRRWVMSFHARGLTNGPARVGSLGYRHPAGCRTLPPPVKVSESGPSWTAGKTVLGRSTDPGTGTAAGAIEKRRDVARISGRKAAQHLRRRVQRSGRKAALACSTSARVAPGTDTSTRRDSSGEGGTAGCRPVWEDFLYVYQGGPQRAARAAAWARVRRSAGAPTPATQHARRLARRAGSPGPAADWIARSGEIRCWQPAAPRLNSAA